jgi:hypothetical protein
MNWKKNYKLIATEYRDVFIDNLNSCVIDGWFVIEDSFCINENEYAVLVYKNIDIERGLDEDMATIKQEAENYVVKVTKTVADLPKLSIDLEVFEGSDEDKDGKPYSYKYVELNGEKFRMPSTVLSAIQENLKENKNLKEVKVKKKGTGLSTEYTVIQITN